MNSIITRTMAATVGAAGFATAFAAGATTPAAAQNGNYFVETDQVNIHSACSTSARIIGSIPPGVPITNIAGYEMGEAVNRVRVWFRLTTGGCVTSAFDTSSFRTPAELMSKFGIGPYSSNTNPQAGNVNPQGGQICLQGTCPGTGGQQSTPARRSGPASFANADIADYMLARVGSRMGQCRDAVNQTVAALSGGKLQLGGEWWDYRAGFRRVGAYQVPSVEQAVRGDIVQIGDGIHTYVVVANYGRGNLRVVDSNHAFDEIVRTYDRSFNYNGRAAQSTIWRIGRV